MKNIITIFTITLSIFLIESCTHSHEGHDHSSHSDEGDSHAGHDHGSETKEAEDSHAGHGHEEGEHEEHEEGLHLSQKQIKTIGLEFGDFSSLKINDYIKATGTLGLPANAYSSLSTKSAGFIRDCNKYVEGDYIREGDIIAYVEDIAFITKQQEYLVIQAGMPYLRKEIARQQGLINADAGIAKNLQQAQSELAIKEVQLKGIKKHLSYLGLNTSNLNADNIQNRIAITAPMSGYITTINMHNGMYVNPSQELIEIVNESHLHLELDVFEKDISYIKKGQKITYSIPALGETQYSGDIHMIGKSFDHENKTIRIHGHLKKKRPKFIKGLFLNAKIWLNDQTVKALPEKAIVKDGSASFIYAAKASTEGEIAFEKIMVMPGALSDGFMAVKLIDEIPEGMDIVTKGAYFVYAQSKAGMLKHEH